MTTANVLKNHIKELFAQLEQKEWEMVECMDLLEYLMVCDKPTTIAKLMIHELEGEIELIKETIIAYKKELDKLQGGN